MMFKVWCTNLVISSYIRNEDFLWTPQCLPWKQCYFIMVILSPPSNIKETYENLKNILVKVQYRQYSLKIVADLKVADIFLGIQPRYKKLLLFMRRRARNKHYIKKEWPRRNSYVSELKIVSRRPLLDTNNILLPPLHMKLRLFKNFVKAMNKSGEGFNYIKYGIILIASLIPFNIKSLCNIRIELITYLTVRVFNSILF